MSAISLCLEISLEHQLLCEELFGTEVRNGLILVAKGDLVCTPSLELYQGAALNHWASAFPWGQYGVANSGLTPSTSRNFQYSSTFKGGPLSDFITLGTPCMANILSSFGMAVDALAGNLDYLSITTSSYSLFSRWAIKLTHSSIISSCLRVRLHSYNNLNVCIE